MAEKSPYDEIYELLQSYKPEPDQQQLERNRKIARVNALGEGLKTLVDVVGGAAGANVQKREVPQVLSKAINDYNQQRLQDTSRMDAWNQANMNLRLKDLADRQTREKLRQDQENFQTKLAQDAEKAKRDAELKEKQHAAGLADKETQRQFLAKQGALNRQNRLDAARISANRPRQTSQTTKAPFYSFYDDQTGNNIPMSQAAVDRIIAEMANDPEFKKIAKPSDRLISIRPPKTAEEKKRLVQDYGSRYLPLIRNMAKNQPYTDTGEEDNSEIGSMSYQPPTGKAISNNTTLDIPDGKGGSKQIIMDIDKQNKLQQDLTDVDNDNTLPEKAKKAKMIRILKAAGFSDQEVKNIIAQY